MRQLGASAIEQAAGSAMERPPSATYQGSPAETRDERIAAAREVLAQVEDSPAADADPTAARDGADTELLERAGPVESQISGIEAARDTLARVDGAQPASGDADASERRTAEPGPPSGPGLPAPGFDGVDATRQLGSAAIAATARETSAQADLSPAPDDLDPAEAEAEVEVGVGVGVDADEEPEIGARVADSWSGVGPIDPGDEDALKRARLEAVARLEATREDYGFEIGGNPELRLEDWKSQGWNSYGYGSTCAISCVQELAHQKGLEVSEDDLVKMAVERGFCDTSNSDPADNGGVTLQQQRELLASVGLDSRTAKNLEASDLAALVEGGDAVLAYVDGQYIADSSDLEYIAAKAGFEPERGSSARHVLHVTGTVRAPETGDLIGFIVNDPTGKPGQAIDVDVMEYGWRDLGGLTLIADRK